MGFFLQLLSDPEYPEIRNQVKKSHILAYPSHLLYSEHVLIKKVKGFDAVVSRSKTIFSYGDNLNLTDVTHL